MFAAKMEPLDVGRPQIGAAAAEGGRDGAVGKKPHLSWIVAKDEEHQRKRGGGHEEAENDVGRPPPQ
jgi:hypothetical protein